MKEGNLSQFTELLCLEKLFYPIRRLYNIWKGDKSVMKVKIISSWRINKHPGIEPVSGAGPCPLAGLGSSTMSLV